MHHLEQTFVCGIFIQNKVHINYSLFYRRVSQILKLVSRCTVYFLSRPVLRCTNFHIDCDFYSYVVELHIDVI